MRKYSDSTETQMIILTGIALLAPTQELWGTLLEKIIETQSGPQGARGPGLGTGSSVL